MIWSRAPNRPQVPGHVHSSSCIRRPAAQSKQSSRQRHPLRDCWLLLVLTAFQYLRPPWTSAHAQAGSVLPASAWRQVNKTCDPGCLHFGNCNAEFGTCECPFGMSGPTCSILAFPACRTSTAPGAHMYYGVKYPKNCECFQQLRRPFCPEAAPCDLLGVRAWAEVRCFRKTDAPVADQLSDLPQHSDTSYSWFVGSQAPYSAELGTLTPYPRHPSKLNGTELKRSGTPLGSCPDRCHDHGWCEGTMCQCHTGWSGLSCELAVPDACINSCSGRGRCDGLFCHCTPPYFGPGCERSLGYEAIPGMPHVPQLARLKIYMYSLPAEIASNIEFDDGRGTTFIIYQAFVHFQRMFLADAITRTENPYEANLFFIPAFLYLPPNLGEPTARVYRAVQYVKHNFPWFNASGGHDHFIWLTADQGACHLDIAKYPVLEPLIKITHFGLSAANFTSMGYIADSEHGCHNPKRDIVAAPYFAPSPRLLEATMEDIESGESLNRDILFAFTGDGRKDQPEYSGGVRQTLANLLKVHDFPDVAFKASGTGGLSPREYDELLHRIKFCIAPYGHGWSIRLSKTLMLGCIPVIIQDHVYQPYEDLLPYEDFSIRIAKRELPQVVEILRAVPDEEVVRLRKNMAKVYRAFIWQPERGGMAYNYTIASLRKRMYTMQSLLDAQRRRRKLQDSAGLQRAHASVYVRRGAGRL